jgi:hypothetical protein
VKHSLFCEYQKTESVCAAFKKNYADCETFSFLLKRDKWSRLGDFPFSTENQETGADCETLPFLKRNQETGVDCETLPFFKRNQETGADCETLPFLREIRKLEQIVRLSLFLREIRKLEQLRSLRAKNWQ